MGSMRLPAKLLFVCAAGAVVAAFQLGAASAAAPSRPPGGRVLRLSLRGVVDPFMASYVERGIRDARDGRTDAVALTIDTPGGLDSSMRDIVRAILAAPVPVVCYTPAGARAASAGTFIMLACPVNGMAPASNIGAAHPVGVSGAVEQTKVTNDAVAYIRGLAERQSRNADWAESAVRNSVSVDASTALKHHVVDFVEPNLRALLDVGCVQSGIDGPGPPATGGARAPGYLASACGDATTPLRQSIAETIFHAFASPDVAFLLLDIAFVALIVWAFHPGFHLPLAVGVVSLALGLAILQTLPVRAAGFSLLFVAAVLFVLDVKAKAHGVLTAGGIVVFILGGLLLFNPAVPNARVSPVLLFSLPVAIGIFTTILVRAVVAAKKEPLRGGVQELLGATGVAETALDPAGRVRVRGESWSAVSLGGPVPAGTTVRIVGRKGLKLEVQPDAVPSSQDQVISR